VNLELVDQTACDDWRQVENLIKLAISTDPRTEELMDQAVEWLSKNWFDEVPQVAAAGVGGQTSHRLGRLHSAAEAATKERI